MSRLWIWKLRVLSRVLREIVALPVSAASMRWRDSLLLLQRSFFFPASREQRSLLQNPLQQHGARMRWMPTLHTTCCIGVFVASSRQRRRRRKDNVFARLSTSQFLFTACVSPHCLSHVSFFFFARLLCDVRTTHLCCFSVVVVFHAIADAKDSTFDAAKTRVLCAIDEAHNSPLLKSDILSFFLFSS